MTAVTVIHVLACVFLVLVILLQAGKGGGMGAGFGGAASQTVFGGRGAQGFLGKVTAGFAGVFMLTSLVLSYGSSHHGSVIDDIAVETPKETAPAAPGTAPAGVAAPANAAATEAQAPAQPANAAAPAAPAAPAAK